MPVWPRVRCSFVTLQALAPRPALLSLRSDRPAALWVPPETGYPGPWWARRVTSGGKCFRDFRVNSETERRKGGRKGKGREGRCPFPSQLAGGRGGKERKEAGSAPHGQGAKLVPCRQAAASPALPTKRSGPGPLCR